MKIAHLVTELHHPGGVGSYLTRLFDLLNFHGHELVVVEVYSRGPQPEKKTALKFYAGQLELFSGTQKRGKIQDIVRFLNQERPSLIHSHGNVNVELEGELHGRFPMVKMIHAYDFCPTGNKYHLRTKQVCSHPTGRRCLADMITKRCTSSKRIPVMWKRFQYAVQTIRCDGRYARLLVASKFIGGLAVSSGYDSSRIRVLPYFVESHHDVPRRTGDGPVMLFSGRIVPEKGLADLLRCMTRLPTVRLIVAGDGPERRHCQKLSRRLRLDSRVDFRGWVDSRLMGRLYREASLTVMPSLWPEPFGITGIESLSHSRPVVAYSTGGIPEWLEDGRQGFLVERGNIKAMGESIQKLISDPTLTQTYGEAGRKKVEDVYNPRSHYEALMEIYGDVLNGFRPRGIQRKDET